MFQSVKCIVKITRQIFCDHRYGDAVMNPFVDIYGNHSAIYTCEKCGYRLYKTFYKQ